MDSKKNKICLKSPNLHNKISIMIMIFIILWPNYVPNTMVNA